MSRQWDEMEPNGTNWTAAKEQAARDAAEGVLSVAEITKRAGVKKSQFFRWKQEAVFKRRVKEIVAELAEVSRQRSIGRREDRVEAQDERWHVMRDSFQRRGKVEVDAIDLAALMKEMREHEKHSAQELNQWADRHEITGPDGGPVQYAVAELKKLSAEDLLREHRKALGYEGGK